jgi:hypothetical protein
MICHILLHTTNIANYQNNQNVTSLTRKATFSKQNSSSQFHINDINYRLNR